MSGFLARSTGLRGGLRTIARHQGLALRRSYADAATDKLTLNLALPHKIIYKSTNVTQVNIPASSGDLGVLSNHVPVIEELRPGVLDVIEEAGNKQFFIAGGFAVVQPGSTLDINAVEAFPLEDFSPEAVRNQIAEANKAVAAGGNEAEITEAKIQLEVLESLQAHMK